MILSDNNDVIIDNNGSLTITRFQPHDEGYYECETYRGEFRQSPVVAVILFGKILDVADFVMTLQTCETHRCSSLRKTNETNFKPNLDSFTCEIVSDVHMRPVRKSYIL